MLRPAENGRGKKNCRQQPQLFDIIIIIIKIFLVPPATVRFLVPVIKYVSRKSRNA